ncbi:hypothetical protein Sango_0628300 [Sesamum angolense]|uniref:Reverse transcriptase domain-containing protein n=1 Tax=Sesamum angolense TaxID=2727404 RepID=A0AAE2C247_9LAMI|nr:hypothetical protein Sango_0628300 [Sesamum angolense]
MQKIFDDMLHKNVECYVDDLVVKSKKLENHFHDLRKVFERLRRYQLKTNPSKCAFGVTSGKFFGFIVRQWGIEIEQAKIDAILKMPEPRNIHELKSLQEKLAYLRRMITPNELKYSPIEKLYLAFIFSIQKLKYYFQSYSIHLVSKANPLKYVMAKPVLSDRLARWLMRWLGDVELKHLLRKDNKQVDALAKLASILSMTDKETRIPICKSWVIPPIFSDNEDDMFYGEENHVIEVFEVEEEDWRQPLIDYLKYEKLPNDL